jgi:hypothetical protein
MKQEVVRYLQKNGVETRFVSILDEKVYINNLKLSRFSRKKEELFLENYPNFEVKRSKAFQKICTRASRVLKNALSPGDKILLAGPENCVNLTLYAVLEPYTRKYGVELILLEENGRMDKMGGMNNLMDHLKLYERELSADSVAIPITLDGEVEHIFKQMIDGIKLELLSSQTGKNGVKLIYPLINVPLSWIESWIKIEGFKCNFEESNGVSRDILEFMESFIPDVREKMMKSALYLGKPLEKEK